MWLRRWVTWIAVHMEVVCFSLPLKHFMRWANYNADFDNSYSSLLLEMKIGKFYFVQKYREKNGKFQQANSFFFIIRITC